MSSTWCVGYSRGARIFHRGTSQIAPGITVHHIGGHSSGLQAVRVRTERGYVVLASDASHFYANFEQNRPFPVVASVIEMLEGYRTLLRAGLVAAAYHSRA